MRLSYAQFKVNNHESKRYLGVQPKLRLFGSRVVNPQRGFTLVELVMVMIIVGVLGAVVAPRFFDNNVFQSRGFADQVKSTLRFAQKLAVAQRRNVCVNTNLAGTDISLTKAAASGAAVACTGGFNLSDGKPSYTAPAGITLTPSVTVQFDALGATATAQAITVTDGTNNIVVTVENGTGYVH